ncbi:MAG: hypothetical protein FWG26_07580 [Betaproteobacteria bacterium]|nr:hypothetical protein [Betaproteobacteria bacterium]
MNNRRFVLIQGKRENSKLTPNSTHSIGHTVANAIQAGFRIGKIVRIGQVDGRIVGYNIGHFGLFRGKDYPLLVRTRYGTAKCSLAEVAAA